MQHTALSALSCRQQGQQMLASGLLQQCLPKFSPPALQQRQARPTKPENFLMVRHILMR